MARPEIFTRFPGTRWCTWRRRPSQRPAREARIVAATHGMPAIRAAYGALRAGKKHQGRSADGGVTRGRFEPAKQTRRRGSGHRRVRSGHPQPIQEP